MSSVIKNKKVSILICFYERPSFLPLIIHNIKSQTFVQNYADQTELLIADDSSPDYSLDIQTLKKELEHTLTDINYIRLDKKLTIGQKRNLLCKTAKHSALIFMDDDDYYFPSYIEYSLFELYKRRKALVGSNAMLFCYVNHGFKKLSISCASPRQIHEATMCMLKSHFDMTGGFNEYGNGEGSRLIDGHENKVNAKLDISKLMVCICHTKNTCNKEMFLQLGKNAEYPFSTELQQLVLRCVEAPIYKDRTRICFKYATRERPEQFMKTLDLYTSMLSKKHDYHFVISMDTDDLTMNNDTIKTYLQTKREHVQLEFAYGVSKNKIDAINRDMIAPAFHILVLISDDMLPVMNDFDDIIVQNFLQYFPEYDGMLNFNDGFRKDWPAICTLTIYGYKYYQQFGYIYNPEYENVYCDNEQTEVGRLLGKIKDIDTVIIRHDWNALEFQDDLRYRTEQPQNYEKDRQVYDKRKSRNFDLTLPSNINSTIVPSNSNTLLTMILVSNSVNMSKIIDMERRGLNVQFHYTKNPNLFSFQYLQKLSHTVQTSFLTFCFPNESCLPEYASEVLSCLTARPDIDVLFFDQKCSFDQGKTSFIIKSDLHNSNENIPSQGPWESSYKRSISNWTIFKTTLLKECIEMNQKNILEVFHNSIKTHHSLNKVLYEFTL